MQKKSVLMVLAAFCLLNFTTVFTSQAQFSLGIKAAANATNYKDLTKKKVGLEAGIFMRLGDRFFFQPEVNYVFKTSTTKSLVDEFNENLELRQHFISVPALLGYHFINNDNFKFRLTIGPRFDFKISDNLGNNDWTTSAVQWGGQVGVGIDFWRFALDFSYNISADRFRNQTTSETQTKMANMFLLSLGFKIVK